MDKKPPKPECSCKPTAPGHVQNIKDSMGNLPIHMGFTRSLISLILVCTWAMAVMMVLSGYAAEMDETETNLVYVVLTGLSTLVGGMINAIFGASGHHTPPISRR